MAALTEIFGMSPPFAVQYMKNSGEIVAYALDFEAQGKSNALSRAIAEGFGGVSDAR